MSEGYRQQPGGPGQTTRKDGKRVAGKQAFPPPGSGGSKPTMSTRNLDFIPESVGGKEPQPAGYHTTERGRTGTSVGLQNPFGESSEKITGQAGAGEYVRPPTETHGNYLASATKYHTK